MSNVGQRERITQNRIVQFFQKELGYRYLGDWQDRENNKNIEIDILTTWLKKCGVSDALINRAIRQLDAAAALGEGKKLYYANKDVYRLLRYGVKDKEGAGELNQTVWLIDWNNPEENDFAIAEEVSIKGENKKRPDIGGSSNPSSKRIWINLELAKKPVECLEFILVHELAHLIERHHNERFVMYMDQFLPQWRERKALLNSLPLGHDLSY